MAEAHSNDLESPFSQKLVADLWTDSPGGIRPDEVARARRHAADRTYDESAVVEEIAAQILLLSRP